jgi:hypothetical protein
MRVIRRLLLAVCCLVAATSLAPARVVHACDPYTCLPVLAGVSPLQVQLDGRPVRLTLSGSNLSAVTTVIVAPLVAPQGWTVPNDQTLVVTLPATIAPGIYSVRVLTAGGASDPSMAPQFQVFPAAAPTDPPTPRPQATPVAKLTPVAKATPAPKPTPVVTPPLPETDAVALSTTPSPSPATQRPSAPVGVVTSGGPPASPASAPIDIMAGLAIGAMFYILWGNPRRLAGSFRSEPLRHLLGRPMQALHAGNICLYCGRLHCILFTRRDLWRAGKYCRPKCFISAEATPSPLAGEEAAGEGRRREIRRRAST